MNKYIAPLQLHLLFQKYNKQIYYIIPILAILILAFASNFFYIDKKVINRGILWDMAGRPYNTFLYELNLPHLVGAIFVGGTPENPVKIDETYKKINMGDIFTAQLRSFLFGTRITEVSLSSYINSVFGISSILFSLLAGYLIFRNGYISIVIFILIALFRNFSQGLIYGLPLRHEYAVFNPLLAFCIIIFMIKYFESYSKKYWLFFVLSGFTIAYIMHFRPSEGQIVLSSLLLFTIIMFFEHLRVRNKNYSKLVAIISIMATSMYIGYFGYQKMVDVFEYHRDVKLHFSTSSEKVIISKHPPFHTLFVSLFRYGIPNKFGDKLGYDAVYERYPELKEKFSNDVNYFELANSEEYNKAIKELYFEFIFNNPKHFSYYLSRSIYDYFLFLPYYSWTGNKSAHAYLPKINEDVGIEPQDMAPDFKNTPFNWILNLKLKYLPNSLFFWTYFVFAYAMLIEALYASFAVFKKVGSKTMSANEIIEDNLPIYLLWGMLTYFFFASVVRILIPNHGQGAVVAFNIIIIYNLVRLITSMGTIEVKKIKIPVWTILLVIVMVLFPTYKVLNAFVEHDKINILENGSFDNNTSKWVAFKSILTSIPCEQDGNCLQITTSENNAAGIAYTRIPVKVGEMYRITAYFNKRGTSPDGQIKVGTIIDDTSLYYSGILSNDKWMKYSGVFRASAPFVYVTLVNLTSTKGLTSFFDSVYVARYEYYSE
ncbi:MAG: hypothetical protein WA240_14655 [Nitrospirota bacterium]